jgi:hypothetical protein
VTAIAGVGLSLELTSPPHLRRLKEMGIDGAAATLATALAETAIAETAGATETAVTDAGVTLSGSPTALGDPAIGDGHGLRGAVSNKSANLPVVITAAETILVNVGPR